MMLFVLLGIGLSSGNHQHWTSPEIGRAPSHWGKWGAWHYCDTGTFAVKFQQKVEPDQGGKDDTGLNGIRMLCSNKRNSEIDDAKKTQSATGVFGRWVSEWSECGEDQFLVGMRVWEEPPHQSDDTTLNAIHGICKASKRDSKPEIANTPELYPGMPYPTRGGNWAKYAKHSVSSDTSCPDGQAIIGFRTKVEGLQKGAGDDTAMNRVQFECGKLPECGHMEVTDVKLSVEKKTRTKAEGEDDFEKNLWYFVGEQNNCESSENTLWTSYLEDTHIATSTATYTNTKTWSEMTSLRLSDKFSVRFHGEFEASAGVGAMGSLEYGYTHNEDSKWSTVTTGSESTMKRTWKTVTNKNKRSYPKMVPKYSKWSMMTTTKVYQTEVKYTAYQQCHIHKGGLKVGKKNKIEGVWKGVAMTTELFKKEDTTKTCHNRNGAGVRPGGQPNKPRYDETCKCANVYSSTGIGGDSCSKPEDFKAWNSFPAAKRDARKDKWCYVFKGACKNAFEIDEQQIDEGLEEKNFEWSKDPCTSSRRREEESDDDELIAPSTVIIPELSVWNPTFVQPTDADGNLLAIEGETSDPFPEERRRREMPKSKPASYEQRKPKNGYWPAYEKDTCNCVAPLSGVSPLTGSIQCAKSGLRQCEKYEECGSTKTVFAENDGWRSLCKAGIGQCVDETRKTGDQCDGKSYQGSGCCPSGTWCQWKNDEMAQCQAGPCQKGWICDEPDWSVSKKVAAMTPAPTSAPTPRPTYQDSLLNEMVGDLRKNGNAVYGGSV